MPIEFTDDERHIAKIVVIGVGGAGGNIVNHMQERRLDSVNYFAVNTDLQALGLISGSVTRIQIGRGLTKGLGAGADPVVAANAAAADVDRLREIVRGMDMVFITAGLGGGTGTGVAPFIARLAREEGTLVVAVVTYPFRFECRDKRADGGLEELSQQVDSLILVPNERLREVMPNATAKAAFAAANDVLYNAVGGIADIINCSGNVNVDFNDVRSAMSSKGKAVIGSHEASGEDRATEAAEKSLRSPLMETVDFSNCTHILINITASETLSLYEIEQAQQVVRDNIGEFSGEIMMGTVYDNGLEDNLRITVIVTGIKQGQQGKEVVPPPEPPAVNISDPSFTSARKRQKVNEYLEKNGGDELQVPAILRRQMPN